MDALSHVAEAASKALFGSTDSSSQHESGEEPISGKLGNVAAGEPYDAGNMGGAQALSNSLCTHHKVHVQITHYVRRVPLREIPREMTVRTRLTLTTGCAGDVDEEPSEVDIETTVEDENGRRVDEDAKQNRTVTTTSTSKVITAGDMRPMPAPKPELAQEDVKTTEKGERMGEDLMDIPTALPPMVLEPERTRALGKDANTASAVPSVSATARKEYEEGKKNKKDIEEEDEGIKMEDLEDPQPEENVLKDDPVDTPTDKETPNPDPQPRLDPSTNPYLYLSPVSTKEKAPEDATTRGSPKGTTNPASTSTFNTGASGEPHLRGSTDFNPLKLTMTPDTTSPTTEKDFHSHTTTSNPFNVLGEQAAKDLSSNSEHMRDTLAAKAPQKTTSWGPDPKDKDKAPEEDPTDTASTTTSAKEIDKPEGMAPGAGLTSDLGNVSVQTVRRKKKKQLEGDAKKLRDEAEKQLDRLKEWEEPFNRPEGVTIPWLKGTGTGTKTETETGTGTGTVEQKLKEAEEQAERLRKWEGQYNRPEEVKMPWMKGVEIEPTMLPMKEEKEEKAPEKAEEAQTQPRLHPSLLEAAAAAPAPPPKPRGRTPSGRRLPSLEEMVPEYDKGEYTLSPRSTSISKDSAIAWEGGGRSSIGQESSSTATAAGTEPRYSWKGTEGMMVAETQPRTEMGETIEAPPRMEKPKRVRSSGLAADGGDFDAAKEGAGREADRLLEQKVQQQKAQEGAGPSKHGHHLHLAEEGKKLHGLKEKIKAKLHIGGTSS